MLPCVWLQMKHNLTSLRRECERSLCSLVGVGRLLRGVREASSCIHRFSIEIRSDLTGSEILGLPPYHPAGLRFHHPRLLRVQSHLYGHDIHRAFPRQS